MKVKDEFCDDSDYESKSNELFEVNVKHGRVEAMPGEIIVEVIPKQDTNFSSDGIREMLKKMGFKTVCLPWLANTRSRSYTAGFKITEKDYNAFKSTNGGSLPEGFFTVQWSRNF